MFSAYREPRAIEVSKRQALRFVFGPSMFIYKNSSTFYVTQCNYSEWKFIDKEYLHDKLTEYIVLIHTTFVFIFAKSAVRWSIASLFRCNTCAAELAVKVIIFTNHWNIFQFAFNENHIEITTIGMRTYSNFHRHRCHNRIFHHTCCRVWNSINNKNDLIKKSFSLKNCMDKLLCIRVLFNGYLDKYPGKIPGYISQNKYPGTRVPEYPSFTYQII